MRENFAVLVDFKTLKVFLMIVMCVKLNYHINISCLSQLNCTCAILSQCLLRNNGTLHVKTNVRYHFLLGKHHILANMVLTNWNN